MNTRTGIEWTDATWSPVTGCSKVSAGCAHCYAETFAHRGMGAWKGRAFSDVRCHEDRLAQPHRWRKSRHVFVNSMSDLFHPDVPDGFIMRCLNVMGQCPQHDFQILTKRPERMRDFFARWGDISGESGDLKLVHGPEETRKAHPSPRGQLFAAMLEAMGTPPPGCAFPTFDWAGGMLWWPSALFNVWLGVSIENQATADERIPLLLQTPAALRFVSAEPLLGPIALDGLWGYPGSAEIEQLANWPIQWVIIGGESGPKARPCDAGWIRSLLWQCRKATVPTFVKQVGAYVVERNDRLGTGGDEFDHWPEPEDGWDDGCRGNVERDLDGFRDDYQGAPVRIRLRNRKGGDPAEWPENLRVREFPEIGR